MKIKSIIIVLALINVSITTNGAIHYNEAFDLIMKYEGFARTVYSDGTQMSIGYGTSTSRARKYGYRGGSVSKAQAKQYLRGCVSEEIRYLSRKINRFSALPRLVRTALISTSYNSRSLIGPKLIKFINSARYKFAIYELAYGHNPNNMFGLVRRRFEEARLLSRGFKVNVNLPTPSNVNRFNYRKRNIYPKIK